jgi:hypothetical protein
MKWKSPDFREISAATFDAVRYARSILLASKSTDNKNKRFIYLSLSKALIAAQYNRPQLHLAIGQRAGLKWRYA